jgi:hypothetical protein
MNSRIKSWQENYFLTFARGLLDGGCYEAALTAYVRAFWYNPIIVLREFHRFLYALVAPLGLSKLPEWYVRLRKTLRT